MISTIRGYSNVTVSKLQFLETIQPNCNRIVTGSSEFGWKRFSVQVESFEGLPSPSGGEHGNCKLDPTVLIRFSAAASPWITNPGITINESDLIDYLTQLLNHFKRKILKKKNKQNKWTRRFLINPFGNGQSKHVASFFCFKFDFFSFFSSFLFLFCFFQSRIESDDDLSDIDTYQRGSSGAAATL